MTDSIFSRTIQELAASGNLRRIPEESDGRLFDLSSNDYMGLAADKSLTESFFNSHDISQLRLTSSASRLLAGRQSEFFRLEQFLSDLYHRDTLLFNSGYHANTGIISAVADKDTLIVADRLVHASIIDGIILSRAPFLRFRHNDFSQLEDIVAKNHSKTKRILVIVESIYSMDGDIANLPRLAELKRHYPGLLLYVDEAHAFGTRGKYGLGITEETSTTGCFDFIVGTFGKAAASTGAFVITSPDIKDFLINKSRSLIFSTAMPPLSCLWTKFVVEKLTAMERERQQLLAVGEFLSRSFDCYNKHIRSHSQIVPLIVGDSAKAITLSRQLKQSGFLALPIRQPTVPPGTERIRFSLSTAIDMRIAKKLADTIKTLL